LSHGFAALIADHRHRQSPASPAGRDTSVVRVFFLWWPMLSMNMVEINVSKLIEFLQASYRQLLHLFSQS
jgi:hypothetical protein